MVRPDDLVLCLSKSGETAEIKALVPLVRHLGHRLIAMTAQPDSTLARQSDYVLRTPVDTEADPNNLAPTASTAAQMALGDALAIALLALRGFTSRDFAQIHPGGALGKQLYLRVADLYPLNASPRVRPDDSIHHTILEITSKRLGATAVVDAESKLVGIVTDGDLRRMLERQTPLDQARASDIMGTAPKTIAAGALAVEALKCMQDYSITQLIVIDDAGSYLGFVHLHDLVREGII
jgi:arabinose-5-phosphate isomerase